MGKIHLLQPHREVSIPTPLFPWPISTAWDECILACVMMKGLCYVTASSATCLSINISLKQPCKPGGTVKICWRIIFLIVCYILKTLGELRKCKKTQTNKLGKELKANMMLIFEVRIDFAVSILVNLISVTGKKMKRESVGI